MITINLSDKQAAELKSMMNSFMPTRRDGQRSVVDEVRDQINNQQFDVSDFESSRQYEALSVNAAYLTSWDQETKK